VGTDFSQAGSINTANAFSCLLGALLTRALVVRVGSRALPRPAWGSAVATFTAVFAAGQTAGPEAIGWLADHSGSLQFGLAACAGLLVLGAVLALAQRDLRHPQ